MGSRPTGWVYLVSLIAGVFGIVNHYLALVKIPEILQMSGNMFLIAVAFVLLLLGVTFKGL
jgi:hypothetical protein